MNEEFKFNVSGTNELLTFAEIDAILKGMMQNEIDSIENRLVEIFDRRLENTSDSLGKMKLRDIMLKFR